MHIVLPCTPTSAPLQVPNRLVQIDTFGCVCLLGPEPPRYDTRMSLLNTSSAFVMTKKKQLIMICKGVVSSGSKRQMRIFLLKWQGLWWVLKSMRSSSMLPTVVRCTFRRKTSFESLDASQHWRMFLVQCFIQVKIFYHMIIYLLMTLSDTTCSFLPSPPSSLVVWYGCSDSVLPMHAYTSSFVGVRSSCTNWYLRPCFPSRPETSEVWNSTATFFSPFCKASFTTFVTSSYTWKFRLSTTYS